MLTTAEASQAILAAVPAFGTESVRLSKAFGRVLRQSVCAERDQPPFDRVTMDGIALRYASLESGNRRFTISGRQHAGDPRQTLTNDQSCIEIMTGAALPENTDCIVPVERTRIIDGSAEIDPDYKATQRQFIHRQGSDFRLGHEILGDGHRIEPMDIAIIASCGQDSVIVTKQPTMRVISTGNELVEAGKAIEDHQIRMSNGPAIVAMLQSYGYENCEHDHIVDDRAQLAAKIEKHLQESDVLVLSGGVSMGTADFVPEILAGLGVKVLFHKVSQRPGKPMWFGTGPGDQIVFALPGNPVSAMVCCRQYVLPALGTASGKPMPSVEMAVLSDTYHFSPALTCFLPVSLSSDNTGRLIATPVPTNTSGDFAALSGTDGYVELALEVSDFPADSIVPLHRWHRV